MNALQIVNSVLRRLRESEVGDFTESYTKLILDFVNETKREVEDSWNWSMLRTVKTVTTANGTSDYSITGAGQRYRFLPRSGDGNVFAFDSTNQGNVYLREGDWVNSRQYLQTSNNDKPSDFAVVGQDASLDPTIKLYPTPNGVYNLQFGLVVPQAELVDTTDILTVPWYPVVMGAWAKGISERGEDGGQNTIEQWQMYNNTLSDAIAQDAARVGETIWQQV